MCIRDRKVAFHTLGCKLNYSETSSISREFIKHGYEKVNFKANMFNIESKFFFTILIFLFYGCVPPPYEPEQSEISTNDHWENTGKINASFISSSRTLGVNTNTGSPSFNVTFIASARSLRHRTLSVISDLTVESGGDVSAVNTNSLLFNFFSKLLLIKSYSFYIFCIWIIN